MGQVQVGVKIAAGPEQVWDVLMDTAHFADWQESTVEVRDAPARLDRVGATFTVDSQFLAKRPRPGRASSSASERRPLWQSRMIPSALRTRDVLRGHWRVIELIQPRLLRFSGTGAGGARGVFTQTLEATDEGTDYTIEMSYELPAGFVGRLADHLLVERLLEHDLQGTCDNLKSLVEGGG